MMMPANFSAIAETEMTYVVGGGLENYLAPVMTAANWQTYHTNLITIIGNTNMAGFLTNTVGTLFSGSYKFGDVFNTLWGGVKTAYTTNSKVADDTDIWTKIGAGATGVANAGLNIAKNLAVVYTLGHGSANASHTWSVVTYTSPKN